MTKPTQKNAAHVDNSPFGFTTSEKSAWPIGYEEALKAAPKIPAIVLEVLKLVESSWVDGYDSQFEDGEVPAMDAVRALIKAAEEDKEPEPQDSLWPIAGIEVRHGKLMSGSLYAPGLPEGWHDVYPCAVRGAVSPDSTQQAEPLCKVCKGARGYSGEFNWFPCRRCNSTGLDQSSTQQAVQVPVADSGSK